MDAQSGRLEKNFRDVGSELNTMPEVALQNEYSVHDPANVKPR